VRAENLVLKELLEKQRVLLNDDQRRRLAVPGKVLGLQRLRDLAGIVTPETIHHWHRQLIAAKWDYSEKRRKTAGRPAVSLEIIELFLRFARENTTWGYDRIQGAFANLGHTVSDQSVGNILKKHVIEPDPERKRGATSWEMFSERPLGVDQSDRLHHGRGLDCEGTRDELHSGRHGTEDSKN